jgi:hypothetical protein
MPQLQISRFLKLFHFLMRRVLAAAPAKLLQLQPVRLGFPVLGGRVIPLFAITALQRNDLSGHRSLLNFWRCGVARLGAPTGLTDY